ncbi:MAG: hypothetical protein ACI9BW_001802 [Gammaproteobacteria bacterium]|jgi:hypothetical protein
MKQRRIAVLMHEKDNERSKRHYLITYLAEHWREDGHTVTILYGPRKFVPADIIIVHVDLSVVPHEYLEFAERYPRVVNGDVHDIRKSTYSPSLLTVDDTWPGGIIVKTNNNYAGIPERNRKITGEEKTIHEAALGSQQDPTIRYPRRPTEYPVFERLADVPRAYFDDPAFVVQKFIPELDHGLYCVRFVSFLGDRFSCFRLKGRHPIVNGTTAEETESGLDPHPEIMALRKQLHFDYGKFDYVVVNGQAILLDANKTTGYSPNLIGNAATIQERRERAKGLYAFF